MARVAEWAVTEASGRQHRVLVDRAPLFGVRVTVDKRQVERFDQTPESDRFVRSLGGHVVTVVSPRVSSDQPTLHVDGKPVLGAETALPAPLAGASDATGAAVSSQDLVRFQLSQRRNSGGAWFYWIGGASILNSVLNAAGKQWGLAVGPGGADPVDRLAGGLSKTGRPPLYAFIIHIAIAGGFFLLRGAPRPRKLGR